MPIQTKIRRIGDSLGIVLPEEILQSLHVGEGDANKQAGLMAATCWPPKKFRCQRPRIGSQYLPL